MIVDHQRWTNDRSSLRHRCVGLLNIFIYYFYLIVAVHPCSFWPIITDQSCSYISGSVGAPWHPVARG